MIAWSNLDTLKSYGALPETKDRVKLTEVMAGESGAERVRKYALPMAEGLTYHYAAKKVDDTILEKLAESSEYGVILRAKGMVALTDGSWGYFDLTPEEYEIRDGAADYTGRLCVIGSELKEKEVAALFGL